YCAPDIGPPRARTCTATEAREMNEERKNGGDGNGDVGGNGDPQFSTPGVGEQLDETAAEAGGPIPGPMEGQGGGEPELAEPEPARPQRKAAPRKKAKSAGSRAKEASKSKSAGRGRSGAGKKARSKGKAKARTSAKRGKK